jgi:divalent metal cation (Fe/Co/Zn/Cd) transporter
MPDPFILSTVAFINYLIMQHQFNASEQAYETHIYGHDEVKAEPVWRLIISVIVLAVMCVVIWVSEQISSLK